MNVAPFRQDVTDLQALANDPGEVVGSLRWNF